MSSSGSTTSTRGRRSLDAKRRPLNPWNSKPTTLADWGDEAGPNPRVPLRIDARSSDVKYFAAALDLHIITRHSESHPCCRSVMQREWTGSTRQTQTA